LLILKEKKDCIKKCVEMCTDMKTELIKERAEWEEEKKRIK
jgi:hypothetical protein